jgi:trimeric autotransporter adhesin
MGITNTPKLALEKPDYLEPRWDLPVSRNWDALDLIADVVPAAAKALVTSANVVDIFVYNTANDLDGGAWTKKANYQSWYWETLNTATRGRKREFPVVALIIAETTKVTIFDLTETDCPMWMVLGSGSAASTLGVFRATATYPIKAAVMLNGVLSSALNSGANNNNAGVHGFNFLEDVAFKYSATTGSCGYVAGIVNYKTTNITVDSTSYPPIVHPDCNDVAMTLILGRALNVYGLTDPCIAVATTGGISIIDGLAGVGTVVDISAPSNTSSKKVLFDGGDIWFNCFEHESFGGNVIPSADYSNVNFFAFFRKRYYYTSAVPSPSLLGSLAWIGGAARVGPSSLAVGTLSGLSLLIEDPITPANGMVAHITKDYNTGWMKGDIRRALICDANGTTETLENLVTSWANYSGVGFEYETFASSGNSITSAINSSGSGYGSTNKLNLVLGKRYTIRASCTLNSGVYPYLIMGIVDSAAGVDFPGSQITAPVITFTFTHSTAAEDYLWISHPSILGDFSAVITVSEAIKDRSVKDTSFEAIGSLNRAPVATGAELQAISGFSNNNYLVQNPSTDADFGTGDFYITFWLKEAPNSATELLFARGYYDGGYGGGGFGAYISPTGILAFQITDDAFATVDDIQTAVPVDDNFYRCVVAQRVGNYLQLYINGVKVANDVEIVNATGTLSNVNAKLLVGISAALNFGALNATMALIRIGVGNLSAAQIAKQYSDELPLFVAGAKCRLQSTSNQINSLTYDERKNRLFVGTQTGITEFNKLVANLSDRIANTNIAKSISVDSDYLGIGTATNAVANVEPLLIRERIEKVENKPPSKQFGDVLGGNYAEFEADGHLKFNGTATVFEDDNMDPLALTGTGTAPAEISFSTTGIKIASFVNGATDGVSGHREVPHCSKAAATIQFHCHWYPTTTNTGVCRFGLEYFFTQTGVAPTFPAIIYVEQAGGGVAWAKQNANFANITPPNELGCQVHFRFFRDGGHTNDTFTGDAAVSTIGYHYEADGGGSRQINVK